MDVTLINPKLRTWSPNVYPPLGLAYIAAALESAGHDVEILDMNSRRVSDDELLDTVIESGIIGITGLITEYTEVVRLVSAIRGDSPDGVVVLGGPLATTHPEEILLASGADVAVIGEGEQTIVELVGAIERGENQGLIRGIAYRTGDKVVVHPPREPIADLDDILFPARHLLDMARYTTHHFKSFGIKVPKIKSTTMISSRGCPYLCSFCYHDLQGKKWRGRSPENIVEEIRLLREACGITGFVFNDDTFVRDRKRTMDFCDLLIESRLDVKWYCNGRVNLMSEDLLEAMARSGCVGIAYGIESGNQGILNAVKKGITLEQVEKVVAATKKAGIHVTGYFMLGILGDTKETIRETFDFAEKLDLDFYGFGITSPIPGTAMYREAQAKGLVGDGRLEDWSFHAWVNLTEDCTKEELEKFNEFAFRKFTIAKRYGKRYLLNPRLWWDGMVTLVFLMRKRNVSELLRKVGTLLKRG